MVVKTNFLLLKNGFAGHPLFSLLSLHYDTDHTFSGLCAHLLDALKKKIFVDFATSDSHVFDKPPKEVLEIYNRIEKNFADCQTSVFVGNTRLDRPLWDLPVSHFRIITAIFEDIAYAIRGVFPRDEEEQIVSMFVKLRRYILSVTSRTSVPNPSTAILGQR